MTWGKALLCWTATPERSLELTLAINNKFGLDGWDPCSYGGVLWCHGLFDGPSGNILPLITCVIGIQDNIFSLLLTVERWMFAISGPDCSSFA